MSDFGERKKADKNREVVLVALFWVVRVKLKDMDPVAQISSFPNLFLTTETFCFHVKYSAEASSLTPGKQGQSGRSRSANEVARPGGASPSSPHPRFQTPPPTPPSPER